MVVALRNYLCCGTAGGRATLCAECNASLTNGSIPKCSLVRFDTGRVPASLPTLTYCERILLSPLRAMRHLVVMKPTGNGATHPHYRGHVTAFPNPPVASKLCNTFPICPSALPQYVNVIFTTPCSSPEDLYKKLQQSPMWQVRCNTSPNSAMG